MAKYIDYILFLRMAYVYDINIIWGFRIIGFHMYDIQSRSCVCSEMFEWIEIFCLCAWIWISCVLHLYCCQKMASELPILKLWVVVGPQVFARNCPPLYGRPARVFQCWALSLSCPKLLIYDQHSYYYYFRLSICSY